jgi:hypothetical protein
MKNKQLKLYALLLLGLGSIELHAQEGVNATGGNASGEGSVSYSIGQVVYTTGIGDRGFASTRSATAF